MFMNFVVALIMCTIGIVKYSYFLSIGYGLSMSFMAFSTLLFYAAGRGFALPGYVVVELIILFVYGIRAFGFNFYKELKTPAPTKDDQLPVAVTVICMLAFAAALMLMMSPVVFRIKNGAGSYGPSALAWIGVVISLGGLAVQIVADYQKSVESKKCPDCFCTKGIFKYVRFPKYTGEFLFWTGIFIGSLSGLKTFWQWFFVIVAYLAIIYFNLDAVKRAENRLYAKYYEGDCECKDEYMAYVAKTPVVIPFVKLYTLRDCKYIL